MQHRHRPSGRQLQRIRPARAALRIVRAPPRFHEGRTAQPHRQAQRLPGQPPIARPQRQVRQTRQRRRGGRHQHRHEQRQQRRNAAQRGEGRHAEQLGVIHDHLRPEGLGSRPGIGDQPVMDRPDLAEHLRNRLQDPEHAVQLGKQRAPGGGVEQLQQALVQREMRHPVRRQHGREAGRRGHRDLVPRGLRPQGQRQMRLDIAAGAEGGEQDSHRAQAQDSASTRPSRKSASTSSCGRKFSVQRRMKSRILPTSKGCSRGPGAFSAAGSGYRP